jgi:dCMP deaminase
MSQQMPWDNYFMNIANEVKKRSADPKTKVGAVLVSMNDNRIISTGYNGISSGIDNSLIEWNNRESLKSFVIHAETNAILYSQSKFENSILYTTLSPCNDCVKLLSATKIKKVIYQDEYNDIEKSKELCKFFNIELKKLTPEVIRPKSNLSLNTFDFISEYV